MKRIDGLISVSLGVSLPNSHVATVIVEGHLDDDTYLRELIEAITVVSLRWRAEQEMEQEKTDAVKH